MINKINKIDTIIGAYKNNTQVNKTTRPQAPRTDVVSISSAGQEFASVLEIVKNVPDIREERVATITGLINQGGYNISAAEIAKKILG